MAKSKTKAIQGFFFMSIVNGEVEISCTGDDAALSAAFASLFVDKSKENKQMQSILGTAIAVAAHALESKAASKKKANPKQMDGVKSEAPFVKTRKKKTK